MALTGNNSIVVETKITVNGKQLDPQITNLTSEIQVAPNVNVPYTNGTDALTLPDIAFTYTDLKSIYLKAVSVDCTVKFETASGEVVKNLVANIPQSWCVGQAAWFSGNITSITITNLGTVAGDAGTDNANHVSTPVVIDIELG